MNGGDWYARAMRGSGPTSIGCWRAVSGYR
jgi:hypothetical protein